MPTSFSKSLITAPLSLVQTEVPHGHTVLCLYLDLLRPSPGLCADHALPRASPAWVAGPIPAPPDLKGNGHIRPWWFLPRPPHAAPTLRLQSLSIHMPLSGRLSVTTSRGRCWPGAPPGASPPLQLVSRHTPGSWPTHLNT